MLRTALVSALFLAGSEASVKDDFRRIGQGCCRATPEFIFEWIPPSMVVTQEIEGELTRGKCASKCMDLEHCNGFELDTTDSHPKCELQAYIPLFTNSESGGCTYPQISCWSKRITTVIEEVVEEIIEEEDCIAADEELLGEDGFVAAGDVTPGMKVRGIAGVDGTEQWCEVLNVVDHGRGRVSSGFTKKHHLVTSDLEIQSNDKSVHYNESVRNDVPLVNIFTSCEAVLTANQKIFTPFSETFCPVSSMTWNQYRSVWNGVMSIVRSGDPAVMYQLMNPHTYHNNASNQYGGRFKETLPGLCVSIAECAASTSTDSEFCSDLDARMDALIQTNLEPESPVAIMLAEQAPFSAVVANTGNSNTLAIVLGSVGGVLVVIGSALAIRRRRSSQNVKPSTTIESWMGPSTTV
jgi:hypothetical protein